MEYFVEVRARRVSLCGSGRGKSEADAAPASHGVPLAALLDRSEALRAAKIGPQCVQAYHHRPPGTPEGELLQGEQHGPESTLTHRESICYCFNVDRSHTSRILACLGLSVLLAEVAYTLVVLARPLPAASDGDYRLPVLFFVGAESLIAIAGTYGVFRGRAVWVWFAAVLLALTVLPLMPSARWMPWWLLPLVLPPPIFFFLSAIAATLTQRSSRASLP